MLTAASVLTASSLLRASAAPVHATPLAVMAYRPNGKLLSLPVRVNRSRVLWFVLDSGARYTIVDSAAAKALRLPTTGTGRGTGVGRGSFTQQQLAPLELSVGPLRLRVSNAAAADLRNTGTRDPYSGLIGWDLLKRYAVRIDTIAHTIAFYDPARFAYPPSGARIALRSPDGRLFINVRLTVDGTSVVRAMRVDTGSEDAASDNLVRESPQRRKSVQGVGLGTAYVDYSGVFKFVQIGPYIIRNAWGPSNDRPAVGMEILRRFTLTFDVPGGWLYLEPNAHFPEPVPSP